MESLASALNVSLGEIVPWTAPWGAVRGQVHGAFIHISPDTLDFSTNSTTHPLFQKDENRDQETGIRSRSYLQDAECLEHVWQSIIEVVYVFYDNVGGLLQNYPLLPLDP